MPDGERKFQELQASGQYSDAQLQSMKADARKQMLQGGKYTPAQIDTYFGDTAPDTSAQHAAVAGNMAKNNQGQLSWWDAFHAGWDTSASAAAMDLATGTKFNNATPQHQGVVNDVLTATGALTGDLPFIGAGMLGGAWAGGTAGTVGGAAAGGSRVTSQAWLWPANTLSRKSAKAARSARPTNSPSRLFTRSQRLAPSRVAAVKLSCRISPSGFKVR